MTYDVTDSGKTGVNKNGNTWLVQGCFKGGRWSKRFAYTKNGLTAAIAERTSFEENKESYMAKRQTAAKASKKTTPKRKAAAAPKTTPAKRSKGKTVNDGPIGIMHLREEDDDDIYHSSNCTCCVPYPPKSI